MAISIQAVPRTLVEAKAYIGSKVIRRTDRLIDSTQSLGAVPSRALELGEVVGVVVKCEQTGKGHKGRPDGISVIIRYNEDPDNQQLHKISFAEFIKEHLRYMTSTETERVAARAQIKQEGRADCKASVSMAEGKAANTSGQG